MDAVEEQVRAYNAGDAEAFAKCYAPDVVVEDADGNVVLSGRSSLHDHYAKLFAGAPNLHAKVITRIHVGSFVIDEEHVTGGPRGDIHAVAVYRINSEGLINRVQFLR